MDTYWRYESDRKLKTEKNKIDKYSLKSTATFSSKPVHLGL